MITNTLDVKGSREIVERLFRDYEDALHNDNAAVILEKREKLSRWLYPLACWYLEHSAEEPKKTE